MMPLWVYMIGGVLSVWAFLAGIAIGLWLYEEHEDLCVGIIALLLTVAIGCLLGYAHYNDTLKKQPKPTAEAPVQP